LVPIPEVPRPWITSWAVPHVVFRPRALVIHISQI
jgi:hypothetical protein